MGDSNNIVTLPDFKQINTEASAWVARIESKQMTKQEHTEMLAWQKKSPLHRLSLERLITLWDDLDSLKQSQLFQASNTKEPRILAKLITHRPAAAAVILFIAISSGLFFKQLDFFNNTPQQPQLFSTDIGIQRTVSLPDGSRMQLNTNTQVEVRYTPSNRDIRLLHGEAFFDVEANTQRPFRVYAGAGLVRAVGTAFSVFLRRDNVEVAVVEGSVEVSSMLSDDIKPPTPKTQKSIPIATVSAGKLVQFNEKVNAVKDIKHTLSWRTGTLEFSGDPLNKVIEDISRYTNVNIIIIDPKLSDLRIGGYFRVGEVDALFEALEQSFGVHVEWNNNNIVHLSFAQ